jgi:hypothetical protein
VKVRRSFVITCLVALSAGCVTPPSSYWVPEMRPVEWLDYAPWDALLHAHVVNGVVDYPAIAASPEFGEFMRTLRRSRFTQDTSAEQRMALWLNGYNAAAIQGILSGGSLQTLRQRRRFFQRRLHAIGGENITLWDLERARLGMLGDPRIHFAIVCASASCPRLASEAFDPERLDAQLERLARAFVNDPTRNQFDAGMGVARISQIFEWYAADFTAADESIGRYLARYLDDPDAAQALRAGHWKIEYLPYDWRLNGLSMLQD